MAKVSVSYFCGCGFRTSEMGKAEEHSEARSHIMTAVGTIQPSTPKATIGPRAGQTRITQARVMEGPTEFEKSLEALKAKLRPTAPA